jgi:hypothetical protein
MEDPAATVTDAGTVNAAALLDKATLAPPPAAACVSMTVQVIEELCPRLVGLQLNEEICAGVVRLTLAIADVLL